MIGKILKQKRQAIGLTQKEVATKLGYRSSQFISNWERDLVLPPASGAKRLAKLYRIDKMFIIDEIIERATARILKEAGL